MESNYFKIYPDKDGFFKEYGGAFVPPVLMDEMKKIYESYLTISKSHNFISELRNIRKHYQGRPTPVYYCNSKLVLGVLDNVCVCCAIRI